MLRPVLVCALLGCAVTSGALEAPAGAPRGEPGVAARVNDTGRDAFFFRSEDGDTLLAFLPEGKAGWSRQIYVSPGPRIAAFALADFDGDGLTDLATAGEDRRLAVWLGDGAGRFTLKFNSRRLLPRIPAALAAVADGPGRMADLIAIDLDGARARWLNDGYAVFERARALPPGDGAIDAPEFPALPFAVRAWARGDFDGDGIVDLALAGYGARPAFAFVPGAPDAHAGGKTFVVPEMPAANCAVAAQPSLTFSPSTCNINAGDTVTWSGLGFHTATSVADGVTCTTCTSGAGCPDPFNVSSTTPVTFNTAGTQNYKCSPHCLSGMRGVVNIAGGPPPAPGTVPDTGTPFRVAKSGATNLALTWGASCGGAATTSYAVYQGSLPLTGGAYNHASLNCNLGNVTAATVTPGAGSRYYLLVPRNGSNEGSYGRNSANAQIPPPATGACLPQNLSGGC